MIFLYRIYLLFLWILDWDLISKVIFNVILTWKLNKSYAIMQASIVWKYCTKSNLMPFIQNLDFLSLLTKIIENIFGKPFLKYYNH